MAGPGALPLGLELVVHQAVEGLRGHLQSTRLAEPLLDGSRAGKPAGGGQARLSLREHRGGQTLLACWSASLFGGQEGGEPPLAIGASPEGHRVPMYSEMRRGLPPCRDLPRLEQDQ
jgi:hypothetical protein